MLSPTYATQLQQNKENLPVVYIAGKVTGLPSLEVIHKFKKKQDQLEALGFFVLNPVTIVGDVHCNWQKAMRISVILLAHADHICLLPDWHLSEGATMEHALALKLGISTIND